MGGLGLGLDELGMDDLAAPAGQGANLGADPLGADPLQGLGASAAAAPPPPPAQQPQQQTLLLPGGAPCTCPIVWYMQYLLHLSSLDVAVNAASVAD